MAFSIRVRVLLALVLVSLVLASGLEADDAVCRNRDGTVRKCTLSEHVTRCLDGTYDAYFQCLSDRTTGELGSVRYALGATKCQVWLAVDQGACSTEAIRLFKN